MKKILSLFLVLAMVLALCSCSGGKSDTSSSDNTSAGKETDSGKKTESGKAGLDINTGVLSMLNMTEKEMENALYAKSLAIIQLNKESFNDNDLYAALAEKYDIYYKVTFYDTLDAMLMALNANDIQAMVIDNSVADYLCAYNDDLVKLSGSKNPAEAGEFGKLVLKGITNDYSFMFREDDDKLRNDFNEAIDRLKADGTLDKLVKEYITAPVADGEIKTVKLPEAKGGETIKVAVTGSLPPMDYVAPDGSPSGFNIALLAEISKKTGKNLEPVVVDSVGRASALASGNVDVVFWTRSNAESNSVREMTKEEQKQGYEESLAKLTDEERETFEQMQQFYDFSKHGIADMPEGTIITDPYYSDQVVTVITSKGYNNLMDITH